MARNDTVVLQSPYWPYINQSFVVLVLRVGNDSSRVFGPVITVAALVPQLRLGQQQVRGTAKSTHVVGASARLRRPSPEAERTHLSKHGQWAMGLTAHDVVEEQPGVSGRVK